MVKFLFIFCAIVLVYLNTVDSQNDLHYGWFHIFDDSDEIKLDPATGLYEPFLARDVNVQGTRPDNIVETPQSAESVTAIQLPLDRSLTVAMAHSPVLVSRPADNRATIYHFRVFKITRGTFSYRLIHPIPRSSNWMDDRAYWLPQGQYIDIPAIPACCSDPQFVFTVGLTGCSIVVDRIDENTLRVYHVQNGREDAEYNNYPRSFHGRGMVTALRYSHYGLHDRDTGLWDSSSVLENGVGLAFLHFNGVTNLWEIHYHAELYEGSLPSPRPPTNLRDGDSFTMIFPRSARILSNHVLEVAPHPFSDNRRQQMPVLSVPEVNLPNPNLPLPPNRLPHDEMRKKRTSDRVTNL